MMVVMKKATLLYVLIWFLVLVATATGVFYRSEGDHVAYVTPRGENAMLQGHGLYRYDPASVAREGIIWDAINLFVGVPLFAAAIYLAHRNSLRGRLLLGGLLFYFFYVYRGDSLPRAVPGWAVPGCLVLSQRGGMRARPAAISTPIPPRPAAPGTRGPARRPTGASRQLP